MDVAVNRIDDVAVVALSGDIDGSTAPVAQTSILGQLNAGEGVVLDMTGVGYMSSAGLRMLLSAHRAAQAKNARVLLVGLSENLQDTMAATGFLGFFSTFPTVPDALAALVKQ